MICKSVEVVAAGLGLLAFYSGHLHWPRLWLPRREDVRFIEAVPLGTGNVSLRGALELATMVVC